MAEIRAKMNFCRIESKYFVAPDKIKGFLKAVREHLDHDPHSTEKGYYQVNTIYFDNSRDDVVFRSMESPTYKCKLRLRSYGGEKPLYFLELKKKFEHDVYKTRIFLSDKEFKDFIENGRIPSSNGDFKHDQFVGELTDMIRRYGYLYPKEVIQYRRQAYGNRNGEAYMRLTVDSNIRVRRDNFDLNKQGGEPLDLGGAYLVEIKLEHALPLWLVEALNEAGAFKGAFSKYGACYKQYAKATEIAGSLSSLYGPAVTSEAPAKAMAAQRS